MQRSTAKSYGALGTKVLESVISLLLLSELRRSPSTSGRAALLRRKSVKI